LLPENLTEELISRKLHQAYTPDGIGTREPTGSGTNMNADLKCAAVLIPLAWFEENWHLLFTRRTERVETHKGQVSFPGGACNPGEGTPEQTALREAEEEIGVRPRDVRVLGRLNAMITITSFRIDPVVGVVPWPYTFQVENAEVARVFTIPLRWLNDPGNRWEFHLPSRKYSLIVYHPYDGELLWGATASMTTQFLSALAA
jgi:8-oxo-dGTP pyrophosphatase MutT (NUDIX family)